MHEASTASTASTASVSLFVARQAPCMSTAQVCDWLVAHYRNCQCLSVPHSPSLVDAGVIIALCVLLVLLVLWCDDDDHRDHDRDQV